MVAAPAAADAVARAKRLERLRVGLHLVVASGPTMLGGNAASDALLGPSLQFAFSAAARAALAREIRAQFEAFRATGLTLDHANVHRHLHLHPTVARLMLEIGRDYGLTAVRIPHEPLAPLRQAGAGAGALAAAAFHAPFAALLRRRVHAAGLAANDHLLGLAWTGGMTEARVLRLIAALPEGVSELYFHPASARSAVLVRAMPAYQHVEELAALLSPAVRARIEAADIALMSYGDLGGGPSSAGSTAKVQSSV
jgi:hopanoid biosynthesis associated protein HpnK